MTTAEQMSYGANKRSVWTVPTRPFTGAHFATFPEEIPTTCILAGSSPGGRVLDPYAGANTTGIAARKIGREYLGIEINPAYAQMGIERERRELGLFY